MKTVQQLNAEILLISMKIEAMFPELSKYLGEMPVHMSYTSSTEVRAKSSMDYYASLDAVLKNYGVFHRKKI
jgi:hypothetical protein